jgi:LysM repeat protein
MGLKAVFIQPARGASLAYFVMTRGQLLLVILLAAIVLGGGGYLVYDALHPYRHLVGTEQGVYVPPIVEEIENARTLRAEGKLAEAQELLHKQLRIDGKRPEAKAARELLGEINTEMFFSTKVPFGKTEYVVKRGDTLWRIARKLDSTPEVIMRTNQMNSDLLRPGDRLLVPNAEFTVTLDLPNERAVVHTGDGFFKQYPIVAFNLPRPIEAPITTKVKASTLRKDGAVLQDPSETERAESTPWLHLASGGYVLYGVSEEGLAESALEVLDENSANAPTNPDIPRRGIALLKEDLAELQLMIDRGTPVTIIGRK